MSKFLLLYRGGKMPETEAESAEVIKAWTAWYTELGSALVDPGNPFTPAGKSVASDGKVSDVPPSAMASGYTILEGGSFDAIVKLARSCPVLLGGAEIAIFETFNVG